MWTHTLFALFASVLVAVPAAEGRDRSKEWLSLSVTGELQEGTEYRLRVGFQPAASWPVEAIFLVAEPSERLIAVIQDQKAQSFAEGKAALVRVETDLSRSAFPAFRLAFDPGQDIGLRAELMTAKGKVILARAKVNLKQFSFSSEYQPELRQIRHCCECGECGRMCADCEDAYFYCNCVACSIPCGW
jgi:hypothetical protein